MKRKIIKQGHNTLTITLPSKWVKQLNLKPGSEVELLEVDGGLHISTEKNNEIKVAEFDVSQMDIPTIWNYFMGVYRGGYDEITVKFNPEEKTDNPYKFFSREAVDQRFSGVKSKKTMGAALQEFTNRFIGFEIVDHGKNFIKIRDMGQTTSKEFDNALRRVFFLLKQMISDTIEAIKKKDSKILEDMHEVDTNLDKFHDYCIRVMNRMSIHKARRKAVIFSILNFMELIGDEIKGIASHLLKGPKNCDYKGASNVLSSIEEEFDVYTKLFFNFDKEMVKKFSKIKQKTRNAIFSVPKKACDEEKEVLHRLRVIERNINSMMELRIEMEF
ncbi:hypothetical protein COU61_04685 [Candidatus Pacearchaeota archaeon CG10_big_fil_rev_8_21_14_0_10_35_13]|nr:MAG: hypothetical protein COU61_04685 [Candidatus Pacearchaeota archaeon CG10_big_fil_rev_8_21_14_0_10_35_13]